MERTTNKEVFRVAVTVTLKHDKTLPLWNKVHLHLGGQKNNLINLQAQLKLVKSDVNSAMNGMGLSLRDVDIEIDFI